MRPRCCPWLTLAVFVATAAVTGASLHIPEIPSALEHKGALIEQGQVWRFAATWLVGTDGWTQARRAEARHA